MTAVDDFLAHFGVKGMKWGQRKSQKKMAKAEKDWETRRAGGLLSTKEYIALHNAAAVKANEIDVPRINGKPEYRNADFRQDSPLRQKYYAEHEKAFNDRMTAAYIDQHGTSPSGLRKLKIDEDGTPVIVDAKHADGDPEIKLKRDARGHILEIIIVDDVLEQSDPVDDFLVHYGVKGMKWGVRRSRGSNGRVSSEAERANELLLKAKKEGGVQALSNKELGDLTKRLQLERQYSQLNPPRPGPGRLVGGFLADIGKTQAKRAVNDLAARQIAQALGTVGGGQGAGKPKNKRTANWLNEKNFVQP